MSKQKKQNIGQKHLNDKEVWDSISPGDLVQVEYLNDRRDALLVKEVSEHEIKTIKLSSGYPHSIFKNSCSSYWI